MGVSTPKVSKGRSQTSSVFIALCSPPQRRFPPVPIKFSQKKKDKYAKTQKFLYPRIPFQAKSFPHLVRGAFAPTQIVPKPDAPIERAGFSVQMRTAVSGVCP